MFQAKISMVMYSLRRYNKCSYNIKLFDYDLLFTCTLQKQTEVYISTTAGIYEDRE